MNNLKQDERNPDPERIKLAFNISKEIKSHVNNFNVEIERVKNNELSKEKDNIKLLKLYQSYIDITLKSNDNE